MAKGMSSRSGPAKDPSALRRERDAGEWIDLPPDGRAGEPPEWPMVAPSDRELELWGAWWALPPAVMWERHRLEYQVALCVRNYAAAEIPGSAANRSTLVKQLMEDIGMTEGGLARNSWRIGDVEPERRAAVQRASSKSRLKVVSDAESA